MEEGGEEKVWKKMLCMHWLLAHSPEGAVKVAWLSVSCETANKVVTSKIDFGDIQSEVEMSQMRYSSHCLFFRYQKPFSF